MDTLDKELVRKHQLTDLEWNMLLDEVPHDVQEWLECNQITNHTVCDFGIMMALFIVGWKDNTDELLLADAIRIATVGPMTHLLCHRSYLPKVQLSRIFDLDDHPLFK